MMDLNNLEYSDFKKYADDAIEEGNKSRRYAWYYLGEEATRDIITGVIYRAILDLKLAQAEEPHASCYSCGEVFLDHACPG